jgi:riboflavin kinase/FMN adenylyltransferase
VKIERKLPVRKPAGGVALTLGVFDGVHRGHRAIIQSLKRRAKAKKLKMAALTFDRHPATVLAPSYAPPALVGWRQKMDLLQATGIEKVWLLPFTAAFSKQKAEDFCEKILVKKLGVKELVIGYDFVFGKHGLGDRYLLAELAKKFGFGLSVARPAMHAGEPVSSTRTRSAVMAGDMKLARILLGRPYRLFGKVVRGSGLGTKLGWPTANLLLEEGLLPRTGVWGGRARISGEKKFRPFIANLGTRPTVERRGQLRLEVHLLDFSGSLLGKRLETGFEHYLRGEKKFASLGALKKQIAKDEFTFRRKLKR